MKNNRKSVFTVLSLFAAVALSACGGGGGTTPAAGTATVSQGVITAKGSVFVNGIEYSTTGATIKIDDNPGTEAQLHEGMVVKIRGTKDDLTGRGQALEIEARDALEGTISAVGANTITVMGQVVQIEDNVTRLNDDNTVKTFVAANFQPGDHVEVHGLNDDLGNLRATRIEKRQAAETHEFEAKGFVNGTPGATSLNLSLTRGGATFIVVNFTAGTLPAGVVDGSIIEVKSTVAPVGGAITASLIHLEDRIANAGVKVEVEGFVSSFTSASDFAINGRSITTSASTVFVGGVSGDIALGVKLEAEGPVDANGNIAATRITFKSNIRIEGDVTAVDAVAGTATVMGLTITGNQFTKGALPAVGDHVIARVILDRSNNLLATRVDVVGASTKAFLQAPVTAFDATAGTLSFTIGAVATTVTTDANTQFRASSTLTEAAVTKAAFFAKLVNNVTVVKVKWDPFVSLATPIKEAEIELGK